MSETPLHVAIGQSNVTAVEYLLKAGADVTIVSEFNRTPLQKAKDATEDIRKAFERAGYKTRTN